MFEESVKGLNTDSVPNRSAIFGSFPVNEDPARITHKNSRTGCQQCRARKVEVSPKFDFTFLPCLLSAMTSS